MRIMIVTPWYPDDGRPNSGLFIKAQALALARQNSVLVVAVNINYKKKAFHASSLRSSVSANLEEHWLEVLQSLPVYNQFNFFLTAYNFALTKARSFGPDIIHASIGYPGALLGWLLARKLEIPFVFTEHTRPLNNFRSVWHTVATRFGIKRARSIMAVSQSLARELKNEFGRNALVVPNIVDVEKYATVNPSDKSEWQLGFIGGMNTPVKGLDILLKAVSKIDQPFLLHICGTGTLLQVYIKLATDLGLANKCKFYGFINPVEMPDFFSRLHLLICSSRYETFNVSLIEAMACGIPVVSTRCGGPEDFVNDTNGILCAPEDPQSLQQAIEAMWSRYPQFESNRLKSFASQFAPEKVVHQLEKIYLDACNVLS